MRTHVTVLVFALAAACSGEKAPESTPATQAVSERVGTWIAALEARDASALADHYCRSAETVVMWPGPVPGTDGAESITWRWDDEILAQEAFLSGMASLTINVEESRIVELSPTSAAVTATAELYIVGEGETEGTSLQTRVSLIFKDEEGVWQIVHEHLSVDPSL